MKNRFDIQKDLVFSDLPAKFHAWERSNSFKNEASSTLIDAFFCNFWPFLMNQYSKSPEVKNVKRVKEVEEVEEVKEVLKWSQVARRYSSPLQWSILTKNS